MDKQNLSDTKKKNPKLHDYCPVCDKDLFLNSQITKRIGLLNDDDDVIGWMCPFCKTEFDFDGKVIHLMGKEEIRGET